MPELQYEPTVAARPVVVETDGGVTRVVVRATSPYAPVAWVGAVLSRLVRRAPKPPRAVFEVSRDRLALTLWDPRSDEPFTFDWPRAAVAEVRANRYESGLWVNVPGHVKETFLADLSRETIERLEAALGAALAGLTPEAAAAERH